MQRPRIVPPVYLLAAIVLMLILHFAVPIRILILWPWRWVGVAVIAAGSLLGLSAVALFRRRQTTIIPGEVSTALMTNGPFRFTRNPIYVGMTLLLIGEALLLGSLSPWIVVPLFIWVIGRNIIAVEEAMLNEAFGHEYEQYQKRVRRWV